MHYSLVKSLRHWGCWHSRKCQVSSGSHWQDGHKFEPTCGWNLAMHRASLLWMNRTIAIGHFKGKSWELFWAYPSGCPLGQPGSRWSICAGRSNNQVLQLPVGAPGVLYHIWLCWQFLGGVQQLKILGYTWQCSRAGGCAWKFLLVCCILQCVALLWWADVADLCLGDLSHDGIER